MSPAEVKAEIARSYAAASLEQPALPMSNEGLQQFPLSIFSTENLGEATKILKRGSPIALDLSHDLMSLFSALDQIKTFLWNPNREKFHIQIQDFPELYSFGDFEHPYGNLNQINFCDFPSLNSPLVSSNTNVLLLIRYVHGIFDSLYRSLLYNVQEKFNDEISFLRLMLLNYTPFLEFLKYKSRDQSLREGCPQDYMFYPHIDTQQPLTFAANTENLIVYANNKWCTLPPLPFNQMLVMPGLTLRWLLDSPQEYIPLTHGVSFPEDPTVERTTFTFYARKFFFPEFRVEMLFS
jgi:hypothetical protein